MPELPEVETVRRGLEANIVGATIEAVEILDARLAERSEFDIERTLPGSKPVGVDRRGKWLFVELDVAPDWIIHLRMSGQLLSYANADTGADDRRRRAIVRFRGGGELHFVDQRRFGEWMVVSDATADALRTRVGPDADTLSVAALQAALAGRTGRLKGLLVNQALIGGLGNMYADEVLWRAQLSPDRPGGSLSAGETRRLAASIRAVMRAALRAGGTSTRDGLYRRTDGRPGYFRVELEVYQREDEPCSRCGAAIRRVKTGSSSTHFCPVCQA